MRKKRYWLCLLLLAAVGIAIIFYATANQNLLGSMSHRYPESTTTASSISFSGEQNERIKFSFRSDVLSGELLVALYDASENLVFQLDEAHALETYFTLPHGGTYTLIADCTNFTGSYQVHVYSAAQ